MLMLLKNGFNLLKVGGYLVYSTCSLTVAQNEDVVEQFLLQNSSTELLDIEAAKDWPCKSGQIQKTLRFDPLTSQTSGLLRTIIVDVIIADCKKENLDCNYSNCISSISLSYIQAPSNGPSNSGVGGSTSPAAPSLTASSILPSLQCILQQNTLQKIRHLRIYALNTIMSSGDLTVPTCENLYKNTSTYNCLQDEQNIPFDVAMTFLEQCERDRARVLVHCMSGKNSNEFRDLKFFDLHSNEF